MHPNVNILVGYSSIFLLFFLVKMEYMGKDKCPVCDTKDFAISRSDRELLKQAGYCLKKCLHEEKSNDFPCDNANTADIIIIGIGNSGAPLAARLSTKFSVIGFEAGIKQDNDPLISNPLAAGSLVQSYTNKFFFPLGHAEINAAPDNKRFPIVAGELFSGGSAVNGLQYVHSTAAFYEEWQKIANDPAWGPANAERVFKEIENFNGVPGFFNPAVHGTNGPVDVRQACRNIEAATLLQNSLTAQGYPVAEDYNDFATPVGSFRYWQLTEQPNQNRETSSTAYLDPIIHRRGDVWVGDDKHKLAIYPKARVLHILFDKREGKKPRAIGVLVDINGKQHKYYARHEIILSTGFQSPFYLQTSGIGNKTLLENLGIPVIYDNPNVGINMENHPIISLSAIGNVPAASNPDPKALYDGGAELPSVNDPGRNFQMIGIANPGQGTGVFTIASLIFKARSFGFQEPYYSDPLRPPRAIFNYFTNPADIVLGVEIYNIMYNTLVGMGLIPLGPAASSSLNPNDPTFAPVRDYVIANYGQAYHWTGMCRMTTSPTTGVVDNNGRVFGVDNLIVADITVAPLSPLGNCMATAYLVSNIIADKLLNKAHVIGNHHHKYQNTSIIKPVQPVAKSITKPVAKLNVCPYTDKNIRDKLEQNMQQISSFALMKGCVMQN